MSEDAWAHLGSAVEAFVRAGNRELANGFRPTQGGWECTLAHPLDPSVAAELVAVDDRLAFDPHADELVCRHCWAVILGGDAVTRASSLWLGSHGYDVELDSADGWVWASLRSRANPSFTVPRFGRGSTTAEAVQSAAHRWQVEQIGTRSEP